MCYMFNIQKSKTTVLISNISIITSLNLALYTRAASLLASRGLEARGRTSRGRGRDRGRGQDPRGRGRGQDPRGRGQDPRGRGQDPRGRGQVFWPRDRGQASKLNITEAILGYL